MEMMNGDLYTDIDITSKNKARRHRLKKATRGLRVEHDNDIDLPRSLS